MAEPTMQQTDTPSSGWQPIHSAPGTGDGVSVWVLGGLFEVPTLLPSDGDYWRYEASALPGSPRAPTLWHPASEAGERPEMPSRDLIEAHRSAIAANEPTDLAQARQTLDDLVPHTSTPMVYVGFLRMHGSEQQKAQAARIEAAMRVVAASNAGRAVAAN